MRGIAERALDEIGKTYVDKELVSTKIKPLPPPKDGHAYHVYCSELNPGAAALMKEVADKHDWKISMPTEAKGRRRSSASPIAGMVSMKARAKGEPTLFATTNIDRLTECDHMVLYLTGQTWTRGTASEALAAELTKAMDEGIHILLAHESACAACTRSPVWCHHTYMT